MGLPSLSQKGKVALITGSRQGIGKAMALAFGEAGADIVISDRITDDGKLDTIADTIRKEFGVKVLSFQTDVTKNDQITAMVDNTISELGHIDVLINNAGIVGRSPSLVGFIEKDFDLVYDINIKGALRCVNAVVKPMMKQKSGSIVNLSSIGAYIKYQSLYSLTKHSLIAITRGLASTYGPYNIRVNAIAPGVIETDMTKLIFEKPKIAQYYVDRTPLGRNGKPDDIAHVALFFASDAARFITGQTILVDGGLGPMELPGIIPLHNNVKDKMEK